MTVSPTANQVATLTVDPAPLETCRHLPSIAELIVPLACAPADRRCERKQV